MCTVASKLVSIDLMIDLCVNQVECIDCSYFFYTFVFNVDLRATIKLTF